MPSWFHLPCLSCSGHILSCLEHKVKPYLCVRHNFS
nr:MAG TPA: hypothetical protein [Caudoviricetes sp.]